ncbi:EVE domain-containing protein [Pseudohoeflea coraliihabitans]|uniref:UPF0310 protein KY465_15595 n=1 Tax=Pseudohoeflea coraliihabitans TaxID=2860393 RepID=A0ABS6WRW0_9HYPH|nr:EVE domain-containing protein [Pseudohoeflea sp. DP4N28-3]MBW3098708.1 EVE domain-containing protein [Pseudohoeflea sp. DP4N28-3]
MHQYWICVASRDHVQRGVEGGFAQLGHGRKSAVQALQQGDWIAYYSPRTALDGGAAVQAFTALGQVTSARAYQVEAGDDFSPWRVDVDYVPEARQAEIRPLLSALDVTRLLGNNWGGAFRSGRLRVSRGDFAAIAAAMGADPQRL